MWFSITEYRKWYTAGSNGWQYYMDIIFMVFEVREDSIQILTWKFTHMSFSKLLNLFKPHFFFKSIKAYLVMVNLKWDTIDKSQSTLSAQNCMFNEGISVSLYR